jgi:DNA sulfur modification protein DndB
MSDTGYLNTFPAVRGVQAGRPCYIAMCPLRLIPKIFVFDEEEVPPELRAQRSLNRSRVPDISSYLVENPNDYTLSAITASVNGKVDFSPMADTGVGQNMGTLTIPMDAQILINDGQHRRAAIEEAIKDNTELSHDHIPVLFFIDEDLKRSQQMFADLNKHAIRPSPSIGTLYDHREQLSELARYLVKTVTVFSRLTELEKSSISNRSTKLFTLSSIKNASQTFLNKGKKDPINEDEMELTAEYWNEVAVNMADWQAALKKELLTSELREQYIHAHGVMLHAMGYVGTDIVSRKPKTWKKSLKQLKKIDWARANSEWENRAIVHGRISKARTNVVLTGNLIKQYLNIPLNNNEEELEKAFIK